MPSRRKSTDMVKRRAKTQVDAELEEKELSPQEQRRQLLLNIGVWFLVLAFCMTSGIMCFSIGGQEKQMQAQQEAMNQDPTQAEIDRWTHEVETNPSDPVALANLGYYWGQKALELEKKPAKKAKDKKDEKQQGDDKPVVTKEEASRHSHEYLDRALAADPNYTFALQKYAELYVAEKNYDKARLYFDKVIEASHMPIPDGDDKEARETNAIVQRGQAAVSLARIDALEKKYADAEKRLDNLIAEQPGNVDAFLLKAAIITEQDNGDKNEALKCYESAMKISQAMGDDQQTLQCHVARATIYKEMGDINNAKQEMEAAKAMFAGNPMMSAALDSQMKKMGLIPDEKKDAPKADATPAEGQPAAAPAEGQPETPPEVPQP